jgi:uncharacterized membrane protein YozB (DUF420 family)
MFDLLISLIVLFLAIPMIISLILTIWVYRDAKKRDMNIFAWILIIWLIPFFIGLIIYIFIREKYSIERGENTN